MDLSGPGVAVVIGVLLVVLDILVRVLGIALVSWNRRPQTALAWLLAIFFVPYIGIALFLIAGSAKLPRARRRKQQQVDGIIRHAVDNVELPEVDVPEWLAPIVTLNQNLGAIPAVPGNSSRVYGDDTEALAAMIRDIEGAQSTVHVEFYIMAVDATSSPFFDALEAACNRGVRVRVLLDHLGSHGYPGYKAALERLESMGALWHLMLPFKPLKGKIQRPDLRNHRKLLVVDGRLAWAGSRNLIDPGYQKAKNLRRKLRWQDFMARFEGPIVPAIDAIFITDWYCETDELLAGEVAELVDPAIVEEEPGDLVCQVVPSGPGFDNENNLRLFNSLVYAATKRVIITSPYFVPDDSMLYAITSAAQSGLDVQLFVGEIGDQFMVFHAQRSYYERLLRAGVRIWLYEGPTILHAKHLTIDDSVSVIGSSNMDMRSFSLDLEISVMVYSESFTSDMREIEQDYRDHSVELTLENWNKRGWLVRRFDDLARLTATVQ